MADISWFNLKSYKNQQNLSQIGLPSSGKSGCQTNVILGQKSWCFVKLSFRNLYTNIELEISLRYSNPRVSVTFDWEHPS